MHAHLVAVRTAEQLALRKSHALHGIAGGAAGGIERERAGAARFGCRSSHCTDDPSGRESHSLSAVQCALAHAAAQGCCSVRARGLRYHDAPPPVDVASRFGCESSSEGEGEERRTVVRTTRNTAVPDLLLAALVQPAEAAVAAAAPADMTLAPPERAPAATSTRVYADVTPSAPSALPLGGTRDVGPTLPALNCAWDASWVLPADSGGIASFSCRSSPLDMMADRSRVPQLVMCLSRCPGNKGIVALVSWCMCAVLAGVHTLRVPELLVCGRHWLCDGWARCCGSARMGWQGVGAPALVTGSFEARVRCSTPAGGERAGGGAWAAAAAAAQPALTAARRFGWLSDRATWRWGVALYGHSYACL